MKRRVDPPLTFGELYELPVILDLRTAARAFGVARATAYRHVRLGIFPCEVLRVGHQYRVPTTAVMRALGISEGPVYSVTTDPENTPVTAGD